MKKVLLITYYWPPAGGAGVQRVLKFAKYLPQFGWMPVVLTVPNPDAPVEDPSLEKDIPTECKVYKIKGWEPFELYKKFTGKHSAEKIPSDILVKKDKSAKENLAKWVRANLFIPDAKIGWYPKAVKQGVDIIEDEKIDIIFASTPPPTTALIGKSLARKTGKKFIVDFRDPWLEIVYYQKLKRSKITTSIDSRLEKKVLKSADAVVTISDDIARLLKSKVSGKRYEVIPNGFDESDFKETVRRKNKKFTIAYTGSMSDDRVPFPLLDALSRIKSEGITDIRLTFAGRFTPKFYDYVKKLNISDFFEIKPFVPHSESTEILQNSDVLLLVIDDVPDNKGFLTGKIFEYLGTKKPVFAIGPVDGNAHQILIESDSGKMVDYMDDDGAYKLLKEYYLNWKEDKINFTFRSENYSRRKNAEQLAKIMDELI